jgi:hypothetical protein
LQESDSELVPKLVAQSEIQATDTDNPSSGAGLENTTKPAGESRFSELPFSQNIQVINLGLPSQRKSGAIGQSPPCLFSEQSSSQADLRYLDLDSDQFFFRLVGMGFSVGVGVLTLVEGSDATFLV